MSEYFIAELSKWINRYKKEKKWNNENTEKATATEVTERNVKASKKEKKTE